MAGFLSNYPNGFPTGVTIRNIPILQTATGAVFWVYNGTALQASQVGGSDGNQGTFNKPFATLNYAMTQCVAARGDVIIVKAGHAETISTATAMNWNKSGVTILGMGNPSNRPRFTLDTANTTTVNVSATGIAVQNCVFVANFLSIAACFTVTASSFAVENCTFSETSGVLNFLNIVNGSGAANTIDGITMMDNIWDSRGTTSVNSFVLSANDIRTATLQRNQLTFVSTVDAAALLTVTAGVVLNLDAGWNRSYRPQATTANGSLINVGGTTSTGFVYNNYVQTLTTTADKLFTTTIGLSAFNNYVTGVKGASGFLIPTADA